MVKAPFEFQLEQPLTFNGAVVGTNVSSEEFNRVVALIVATLECGYYPKGAPSPMGTADWAKLACTMLAATGRGYAKPYEYGMQAELEEVRAGVTDPSLLSSSYPTLFYCLAAIAEHIEGHVSPDLDMYQSWYLSLKADFYKKASEAATIEVDELCRCWKASEIDRRAMAMETEIAEAAKQKNHSFFYEAAADIGLQRTYKGPFDDPPVLTLTRGNKRTTKGTADPAPRRINLPRAVKKVPTAPLTPRGRPTTPTSTPLPRSADPSPTPR